MALVRASCSRGRLRSRPILLTSLFTTMSGLSPLTSFASGLARFLQPMALTILLGLPISTALILVVMPCADGVRIDQRRLLTHPWRGLCALVLDHPVHATAQELVRS